MQYSCVYVILKTDNPELPESYGLTFTLGRGNEIIAQMCMSMQHLVVGALPASTAHKPSAPPVKLNRVPTGKDLEVDILSNLMEFSRTLTQDGQLRWIGPEKGVLSMACGAILNGVWDMWTRKEGKLLAKLLCHSYS